MELLELAADVVERARRGGASAAECVVSEGEEFSATVRLGEVERLKEAGSRAIGLRVLDGTRAASSYTSDFTDAGVAALIRSALDSMGFTSEDPHAGLPDPAELGAGLEPCKLGLFSDEALSLDAGSRIDLAKQAEQTARDTDPRIVNSDGATVGAGWSHWMLANSSGFSGKYRSATCSLSMVPVAESNGQKERDYWYTVARSFGELEDPAEVGRIAAERTLRRLDPTKVASQRVPVVFEPRTAKSLLGHLFSAVSGDSVYREASFLANKLGQRVADAGVTVVDDGLLPGGFGTSPFDDEGVRSRRTPVVTGGVLENYLLNSYTARKLGMATTGNASRSLVGNPSVGAGNLMLAPGPHTAEEVIGSVKSGLYVTELIGFGVNLVSGDYSRGASGYWIENGEFAYPVSEITIAGNLAEMFLGLDMIGSDLDYRGSTIAPTVRVREMTVAGR